MQPLISFKKEVLKINKSSFDELAIRIFHYQANNNLVYKKYLQNINKNYTQVTKLEEIPFLPIEFFKSHHVVTGNWAPEVTFLSSGTTGQTRSSHYIEDISFYHQVCTTIFEKNYSSIKKNAFLSLLPSYIEQGSSSLVSMVEFFISESNFKESGFYLQDYEKLIETITSLKKQNVPVVLFGVTYALLDLAEQFDVDLSGVVIIETGGMKGRREELSKDEVHKLLSTKLKVDHIHSEYGMTELLSQAYSQKSGIFNSSNSLKILIRDINDPFEYIENGNTGGVNVIDLANVSSCCFIETKDIGIKLSEDQFKILGRFDNSDIRGCNLLVN